MESKSSSSKEQKAYTEKLLNWQDKNARAVVTIRLACEAGSRVHIKGLEDAVAVWVMLKKQYEVTDLVTVNLVIGSMCLSKQIDFNSIEAYGQNIKEKTMKCSEMGYSLSD